MWNNLLSAVGLMLVLEGILPFISPDRVRRTLMELSRLDDRVLRGAGLVSMVLGLVVLYWLR